MILNNIYLYRHCLLNLRLILLFIYSAEERLPPGPFFLFNPQAGCLAQITSGQQLGNIMFETEKPFTSSDKYYDIINRNESMHSYSTYFATRLMSHFGWYTLVISFCYTPSDKNPNNQAHWPNWKFQLLRFADGCPEGVYFFLSRDEQETD